MFRRGLRVLKYGTIIGVTGGCTYTLQQNDWHVSSIGAVRFGRAAAAVSVLMPVKKRFLKLFIYSVFVYSVLPRKYFKRLFLPQIM